MTITKNKPKIFIAKGNITELTAQVIVNAANHTLLGGGGVDGAIHRAAGPELLTECKKLNGCKTGEAKITKGYNLPAKYIIHTVGPIYGKENGLEVKLLAACYTNSLRLAESRQLTTIAFPCISTGVFAYPKKEAAKIAIETTQKFLTEKSHFLEKVIFVTLDDEDFNIYTEFILNQYDKRNRN